MDFKGVFVATVTPFLNKSGEVDFKVYKDHLNWLMASGVDGFVPCGTTGEGPCLSELERQKLIELSSEIAEPKKLKVIAGCASNATATVLKMILAAKEAGAHAALVVTPYYNKPTQEGLIAHYEFLADHSSIPLILYHVPGRTNVTFQLATLQKLFSHTNIIGIKEASGNHGFWMAMAEKLDWNTKSILAGDDDAFALIQQLGGKGIISATANIAPEFFVKIFQLTEAGDWAQAFKLQKKIYPLIQAMFSETNPSPIKYGLKLLNRMENNVRLPLVTVLPKTEIRVSETMKALGLL